MSNTQTPATGRIDVAVGQPELLAALTFAGKGIPRRVSVPVLAGVILAADGGTVTVETFDYEQARRIVLRGATVQAPGTVLVAWSRLHAIVKALPKDRPLTLTGEGAHLRLANGKTSYMVPTMPVEDYPARPDALPAAGLVDAAALAEHVGQVAKFAGRDETLPMMTGIHVVADGDRLLLESTDRYRLAVHELAWANEVDKLDALVPAKLLAEVTAALAKDAGALVTIGYASDGPGDGRLSVETDHMRVWTRLIDGANYPPVRQLTPAHPVHEVDVDAKALVATVGRILPVIERTEPMLLRMTGDTFTVTGGRSDDATASEVFDGATFVGVSAAERTAAMKAAVKAAVEQARKAHAKDPKAVRERIVKEAVEQAQRAFAQRDLLVGVNPGYFVDVLTTLGTKRVRIRFVDGFKPFSLVGLDSDGAPIPGVTNLQMPIRVTDDRAPEKPHPVDTAKAIGNIARKQDEQAQTGNQPQPEPQPEPEPAPPAAEPTVAEPVAEPVTDGGGALDRTVPHAFDEANPVPGRKPNAVSKCRCGTTLMARVHKAARKATVVVAQPTVPDGPVWMAVLQLSARVNGQPVVEATEAGADTAVQRFGKALGVLVAADDHGKRMYVATASRQDADRMQTVAAAAGIGAYVVQGTWPPQGAAASEQEGAQVKGIEQSPVIVDGEPKFDPREAAKEAFRLYGSGRFDEALALIDQGVEVAPEHKFRDAEHRMYGWSTIREAIVAKQLEAEITAEALAARQDALADIAVETEPVDADPEVEPEPAPPAAEPEAEPVAVADEDPMLAQLRAALAGLPDEVVEAAMAAAQAQATPAQPVAVAATVPAPRKTAKTAKAAAPAKAAPVAERPSPTAADEVARWKAFGMQPPVNLTGERVFVLPTGTRLRALRSAVIDGLKVAKADGTIGESPTVTADKEARPYRLRVRFAEPGALTAATELVNALVEQALPDVLPASALA
jgi:DNA polymerase III beta subunit